MRILKSWMPVLSGDIINDLIKKDMIELKTSKESVLELIEELMLNELMVEDRLNEEVKEILKKFDTEIEKRKLDYRKLFELTKQKLVKERNIIL